MIVSFIIPAYNASDTIERCLNSIYALSLKREEFEVIVIDDCSTDDTCDIIERYVRDVLCIMYDVSLNNLSLLRQVENHRQGAARNRGMKIAKGEYICFVDADDAVEEGIVEAIRLAKEKRTEMTAYHYTFVNEIEKIVKEGDSLSFAVEQLFSGVELQNKHPYWCSAPWGYIYNKEFIERVNYPFVEDVLYEDSDFVATHLYYAKRMSYFSALGYFHHYREGSVTRSINYKNVADYLLLGTRMMTLYERIKSERTGELENEEVCKFAEGILKGACYNMERSCRRLIKLNDLKEVRAFYNRVDAHVNRKDIVNKKLFKKYYWNAWTGLCMRYKMLAISLLFFLIPIYHTAMRRKA